jgi:hypothetical protein
VALDRDQWREPCEYGKESAVFLKGGEYLDYFSDCWFLKKDSA